MQKFSELIKKSTEDGVGKKKPAVQKGRFKIAKSDDDKMLAFGWANVSITADGELIEDYQEDIIEPEELEVLLTSSQNCTGRAERCTKEAEPQSLSNRWYLPRRK